MYTAGALSHNPENHQHKREQKDMWSTGQSMSTCSKFRTTGEIMSMRGTASSPPTISLNRDVRRMKTKMTFHRESSSASCSQLPPRLLMFQQPAVLDSHTWHPSCTAQCWPDTNTPAQPHPHITCARAPESNTADNSCCTRLLPLVPVRRQNHI